MPKNGSPLPRVLVTANACVCASAVIYHEFPLLFTFADDATTNCCSFRSCFVQTIMNSRHLRDLSRRSYFDSTFDAMPLCHLQQIVNLISLRMLRESGQQTIFDANSANACRINHRQLFVSLGKWRCAGMPRTSETEKESEFRSRSIAGNSAKYHSKSHTVRRQWRLIFVVKCIQNRFGIEHASDMLAGLAFVYYIAPAEMLGRMRINAFHRDNETQSECHCLWVFRDSVSCSLWVNACECWLCACIRTHTHGIGTCVCWKIRKIVLNRQNLGMSSFIFHVFFSLPLAECTFIWNSSEVRTCKKDERHRYDNEQLKGTRCKERKSAHIEGTKTCDRVRMILKKSYARTHTPREQMNVIETGTNLYVPAR